LTIRFVERPKRKKDRRIIKILEELIRKKINKIPGYVWMKLKDEIGVVVTAFEVLGVMRVLKSTLATVPPENPTSIYFVESMFIEANFLIVYVVEKVILFGKSILQPFEMKSKSLYT